MKSIKWAFRPIAQPSPSTEYSREYRKRFHFGQPYWFAMSSVEQSPVSKETRAFRSVLAASLLA